MLIDKQNIENNYLTTVSVDGVGDIQTVGPLVQLSQTPGSPKGNPPVLGEGNEEILKQFNVSAEDREAIAERATEVREALLAEIAKMRVQPEA